MKTASVCATACVAAVLSFAAGAHAQEGGFAVGGNIGTTGLGAQVMYGVNPYLTVRGTADRLNFDRDETYDDIDYGGKLKSQTVGVFADLHPWQNPLFISGGAYFGDRKIDIDATPAGNVEVGGVIFTPEQIGRLEGDVSMSDVQPFVGIGYDNTFTSAGPWGFRAMLGVSFSDDPEVSLVSVGGDFSNRPEVIAAVEAEEAEIRDDADDFKYYPVAQVGVTYRF